MVKAPIRAEESSDEDAIARLRAAIKEEDQKAKEEVEKAKEKAETDYRDGLAAGKSWAKMPTTSHRELRRLATRVAKRGGGNFFRHCHMPTPMKRDLHMAICGGSVTDTDSEGFWKQAIGEQEANRIEVEAYARGFIDGAIGFWEQVQQDS